MKTKLEEELGLPPLKEALAQQAKELSNESDPVETEDDTGDLMFEEMAAGLERMIPNQSLDPTGVDEHSVEMTDIYTKAMEAYDDLFTLGKQMEPKNAGANGFMPAAKMLEIALKASQSKSVKKMERIQLIMEQENHRKALNDGVEDGEIVERGSTIVANRNDLLVKIKNNEI